MEYTTYQKFYDEFLKSIIDDYHSKYMLELGKIRADNSPVPRTSQALIKAYQDVEKHIQQTRACNIPSLSINSKEILAAKFKSKIEEYNKGLVEIENKHKDAVQLIEDMKQRKVDEVGTKIQEYEDNFATQMRSINDYLMEIKARLPEISNIMSLYGISFHTEDVDFYSMSKQELESSLALGLYATRSMGTSVSLFNNILKVLYFPIDSTFITKVGDSVLLKTIKLVHFAGILIVFYMLKPYSMAFISVVYLCSILANLFRMRERKELIRFAYTIADGLDLNYFLENDEEYQELVCRYDEAMELDISAELHQEEARYVSERDQFIETNNPDIEMKKLSNVFSKYMAEMDKDFKKIENVIRNQKDAKIIALESRKKDITKSLDELAAMFSSLGNYTNMGKTLKLEIAMAVMKFRHWVLAEGKVTLPLRNMLFLYKTEKEFLEQIDHIKLLLVNFLSNVRYLTLSIDLVDTENLGRDFTEFNHRELDGIITTHIDKEDELYKKYSAEAAAIIKKVGRQSVQEFNTHAESKGMITLPYKILLIITSTSSMLAKKEYAAFLQHSANTGLFVWFLHKPDEEQKREMELYEVAKEKMLLSEKAYEINNYYNNTTFKAPYEMYKYHPNLGYSIMKSLLKDFENDPGDIKWWTDFMAQYIPPEKQWKETTLDGILINYGYMDGDPSLGGGVKLGDAPVHGLMIGTTGAGKSALANYIIACLVHRYSPEWLEIVLLDFKNAEFPPLYAGDLAMPHIRLISGTKDGEYAISVFDYLLEEMSRRTALFNKYSVNHIQVYNELILDGKGRDGDKILPRILFYIDEFTVMYLEVAQKALMQIEKKQTSLANLARFCGCHMLFQTQNFSGTMNKATMEQFALRVSLRAASSAAEAIIGTSAPSRLPKRGQCYTNESLGEDQRTTKRWVIPFVPVKEVHKYKPKLKSWCEKGPDGLPHLDRKPPLYNEDESFNDDSLREVFNKYPILTGNPNNYNFFSDKEREEAKRTIILGERTSFTAKNVLQNNFRFTREGGDNIMIGCEDKKNLLDIVNTLMINLDLKGITYTGNVQDKDNNVLLDIEHKVSEEYVSVTDSELDPYEFCDILESIVNSRMEDQLANHEIVFFFLINWENMYKFGDEADFTLVGRYKKIFLNAPKVNVYFVMATKEPRTFLDFMGVFKHKIAGKLSDSKDGYAILKDECKAKEGFAIYLKSDTSFKFKIYDCPVVGEIMAKEMIISGA